MNKLLMLMQTLIEYPLRLFNGISFRAVVVNSHIDKTARIQTGANIRYSTIGKYTYISKNSSVIHTTIGAFCSIAGGVAIGGGSHNLNAISTSPVFQAGQNIFHKNFAILGFEPYKKTEIGNDVWIGNRAIILQGLKIGDGAVIGAGSVVTHDVEPYSIIAGNPARLLRKRFDEATIKQLMDLKWWEQDEKWLQEHGKEFSSPVCLFENEEEKRT